MGEVVVVVGGGIVGLMHAVLAGQLWEEIAGLIPGMGFRPHGSMTLASNDAELTVLKEAAARPDAADRGYQLLHPDEVAELNPALRGSFAGGLLGGKDAIVEPRLVPEAIRTHLRAAGSGYSWLPGREVIELRLPPLPPPPSCCWSSASMAA
jgi:L-2-hydroxyglutarate oxidase LhgO